MLTLILQSQIKTETHATPILTLSDAQFAATFSQDGRVLFFARFDGRLGNVYWVSTKALERFWKLSG
jgi:hypothetical protein